MYKGFILNRTKSLLICSFIFSSCELYSLGCGAAFDSSALSFRIKSRMTKEKLFSKLYYTLWGYYKFKKMPVDESFSKSANSNLGSEHSSIFPFNE